MQNPYNGEDMQVLPTRIGSTREHLFVALHGIWTWETGMSSLEIVLCSDYILSCVIHEFLGKITEDAPETLKVLNIF